MGTIVCCQEEDQPKKASKVPEPVMAWPTVSPEQG